jgi:hypothetical protein
VEENHKGQKDTCICRESNKRVLELEARLEESLAPPPRIAGSRYVPVLLEAIMRPGTIGPALYR